METCYYKHIMGKHLRIILFGHQKSKQKKYIYKRSLCSIDYRKLIQGAKENNYDRLEIFFIWAYQS